MKPIVEQLLEDQYLLNQFKEKISKEANKTYGEGFVAEQKMNEMVRKTAQEAEKIVVELEKAWKESPAHKGELPKGISNDQYYKRAELIRKMRIQLEKSERVIEKEYYKLKTLQKVYDGLLNVPEVDEYIKSLEINMKLKVVLDKKLEFLMEHAYPEYPITPIEKRHKRVPEVEERMFSDWKKNPDKIYSWWGTEYGKQIH